MTSLTVAAVRNADILRRLQPGNPFASKAALAREFELDKSNFSKTIKALENDGLVTDGDADDANPLKLTTEGAAMIRRLDAAERADQLQPGAIMVPHAQLRTNPLNPRKTFDEAEIRALAETMHGEGILQNLTVSPADLLDVRLIYIGERRWRAAALLIADGVWMPDHPMPCVEREPTDDEEADALFLGLVENGRREPLTWLEEARAYHALIERTGRSARDVALKTGKDPRVVQEMVKVVREAAPQDIASHERGEITAEDLRYSVRAPAAAAPSSIDKMNERMREREAERRAEEDRKYQQIVAGWNDDGETYLRGTAWGTVQEYDAAIRADDHSRASDAADVYNAVIRKLNGGDLFRSAAVADGLAEYCKAADGDLPMWGQQGAFVIQCDGFRALVTVKGNLGQSRNSIEFHAIDVDDPFISNTGYRSHFIAPDHGHALEEALPKWVYGANWDSLKERPQKSLHPIDQDSRERLKAAVPEWVKTAEPIHVATYTPEPAQAKAPTQTDIEEIAPRPKPEALQLAPDEELALVELAHKIGEEGTAIGGVLAVPVGKIWLDAAVSILVQHRLIETKNYGARGWHANTTEAGRNYLVARDHPSGLFGDPITAEDLAKARSLAAYQDWPHDRYVSDWLNVQPSPEPEATTGPDIPILANGDDDDDRDPELIAEADAMRAALRAGKGAPSAEAFAGLLKRCGVTLPLEIMADDDVVTCVIDANQEPVTEIDSDCLWSSNRNQAVAELIALALNVCAGAFGETTSAAEEEPAAPPPTPAVPIRKSIRPEHIVCLEDGRTVRSLVQHLRAAHDTSPDAYRSKWNLPRDYPMLAPNFARERYEAAQVAGVADAASNSEDEEAVGCANCRAMPEEGLVDDHCLICIAPAPEDVAAEV